MGLRRLARLSHCPQSCRGRLLGMLLLWLPGAARRGRCCRPRVCPPALGGGAWCFCLSSSARRRRLALFAMGSWHVPSDSIRIIHPFSCVRSNRSLLLGWPALGYLLAESGFRKGWSLRQRRLATGTWWGCLPLPLPLPLSLSLSLSVK